MGCSLNTQGRKYSIKIFASNAKPIVKILIEYNCNKLEENEAINIEFTEQKDDPENDKNDTEFKWSDVKREDEKQITKPNLIESLNCKLMRKSISNE